MSLVDNLRLRRPQESDAAQILSLATDPEIALWNPLPTVHDQRTALAWCRSSANWAAGAFATWVVVDDRDGALVATCSLFDVDVEVLTGHIGYRVAAPARGQGVARVTLDATTRWSFAEFGLVRIELAHSVGNDASCRVALACGFAAEGTLRSSHVDGHGRRRDEHIHGRLVSDPVPDFGVAPVLHPR
jgi:RimJ/RimL family protein N-acetyltransferase